MLFENDTIQIHEQGKITIRVAGPWRLSYTYTLDYGLPQELSGFEYERYHQRRWEKNIGFPLALYHHVLNGHDQVGFKSSLVLQRDVTMAHQILRQATMPNDLHIYREHMLRLITPCSPQATGSEE